MAAADYQRLPRRKARWLGVGGDPHGWATAEVGGGDEEHLRKIAEQMNKVLELGA